MAETKKRLGQHWLHDSASLQAIAAAAELTVNDTVLEVGPGLGTLTSELAAQAGRVVAVELDDDLIAHLKTDFAGQNVEVVHASILDFDLAQLPSGYKVVANIPYYLTAKLIRRLLTADNSPATMVLLVQKEVAERLAAQPGDLSLLAISAQFYAEVTALDVVSRQLFTPPPEVDSQIVKLVRRPQPLLDVDETRFFKLVRAGFSERRKKLRSSLAGGLHLDKPQVDARLKQAGIDADARAQALTLEQWQALYQAVYTDL